MSARHRQGAVTVLAAAAAAACSPQRQASASTRHGIGSPSLRPRTARSPACSQTRTPSNQWPGELQCPRLSRIHAKLGSITVTELRKNSEHMTSESSENARDRPSHTPCRHGYIVRRRRWLPIVWIVGAHVPEALPQDDFMVAPVARAQEYVAALGAHEETVYNLLCSTPRIVSRYHVCLRLTLIFADVMSTAKQCNHLPAKLQTPSRVVLPKLWRVKAMQA